MTLHLGESFKETALKHPHQSAIQFKKDNKWSSISYGELKCNIGSLSAFLLEQNIKKNDRVAVILENRPEWPIVFFSTASIGGICVPINPEASQREIENILIDSQAKIVFVNNKSFLLEEKISSKLPFLEKIISVDSDLFKKRTSVRPSKSTSEAIESDTEIACILYTSGTTDKPKGVMLSHGNLLSNCDSLYRANIITQKDSIISILPLHHAYPLTITMIFPLVYGGKIIYPGTMRGEELLAAMRETNPTVFIAVPQIFYSFHQKITEALGKIPFPFSLLFRVIVSFLYMVRNKTKMNLARYLFFRLHKKFGRSLRLFASGGAKLDENVERDLFKFGFTILEGYGLTETSPVLTFNPLENPKIGSVGLPIPDVEIKILDKDKEGVGEVIARGSNIMEGYYKRDDLTAGVIKDGWFHTGDLGYIDTDGYLFLTGRSKDVIVLSSGLNINPEEIEEVYSKEVPSKEMCVFEVPSKKGLKEAQVLWAVVVPDLDFFKKYGEVNLKNVIKERFDNVSRILPPSKRIMGFSITLEPFPRTLLGKIKRFAVKEIYTPKIIKEEEYVPQAKKLSEEDRELAESYAGKKVIDYLKKQTKVKKPILPDDSLELDLGIDSLGRVDLALGLEKLFNIEIKDETIGLAFTVKDLILGIESLLARGAESLSPDKKEVIFDSRYWKRNLEVPPRDENLKKIDLKPGFIAWLGCFLFTLPYVVFFKLFYNLKIEGKENFPKSGPYILYVNHTSYFDGFLMASSLPNFPRLELFFVGFRPYFTVPVIRNLVRIGRIIPLDFSSHLLEALRSSYYVLKNKKGLCLFPEGLRTLDGKIGKFKKGFGILAKETKAKLMPIYLKGAFEAWPRTSKFPKRHPIKVTFGKVQDVETVEKEGFEMGAKDSYDAICIAARKALIKISGDK